MDDALQQLGIYHILPTQYNLKSNRKLKVFSQYHKPTLKKLFEKDPDN